MYGATTHSSEEQPGSVHEDGTLHPIVAIATALLEGGGRLLDALQARRLAVLRLLQAVLHLVQVVEVAKGVGQVARCCPSRILHGGGEGGRGRGFHRCKHACNDMQHSTCMLMHYSSNITVTYKNTAAYRYRLSNIKPHVSKLL